MLPVRRPDERKQNPATQSLMTALKDAALNQRSVKAPYPAYGYDPHCHFVDAGNVALQGHCGFESSARTLEILGRPKLDTTIR